MGWNQAAKSTFPGGGRGREGTGSCFSYSSFADQVLPAVRQDGFCSPVVTTHLILSIACDCAEVKDRSPWY